VKAKLLQLISFNTTLRRELGYSFKSYVMLGNVGRK